MRSTTQSHSVATKFAFNAIYATTSTRTTYLSFVLDFKEAVKDLMTQLKKNHEELNLITALRKEIGTMSVSLSKVVGRVYCNISVPVKSE